MANNQNTKQWPWREAARFIVGVVFVGIIINVISAMLTPKDPPPPTIAYEFLVDTSVTMLANLNGQPRYKIVNQAIESIAQIPAFDAQIAWRGLRFAGGGNACDRTELVSVGTNLSSEEFVAPLNNISPEGVNAYEAGIRAVVADIGASEARASNIKVVFMFFGSLDLNPCRDFDIPIALSSYKQTGVSVSLCAFTLLDDASGFEAFKQQLIAQGFECVHNVETPEEISTIAISLMERLIREEIGLEEEITSEATSTKIIYVLSTPIPTAIAVAPTETEILPTITPTSTDEAAFTATSLLLTQEMRVSETANAVNTQIAQDAANARATFNAQATENAAGIATLDAQKTQIAQNAQNATLVQATANVQATINAETIEASIALQTQIAQVATDIQATANVQATQNVPTTTAQPTEMPTRTSVPSLTPTLKPTFSPTATVNLAATANAVMTETQFAQATVDYEQTATLWTLTPTSTLTPSNTPTITPTFTLEPIDLAIESASNFTGANDNWQPVELLVNSVPMVLVPAGCFNMGAVGIGSDDQRPVNKVCFDKPFWMDKYEVSNSQFSSFNGVAERQSNSTDGSRPRENITWFEAYNFCQLRELRLPTEAEWEYAARGPDGLMYPWGNTWDSTLAAWDGNSSESSNIGSFPLGVSWVGAQDMAGNMWEFTSTIYGYDADNDYNFSENNDFRYEYPYQIDDGRETFYYDPLFRRVIRGGGWYRDPEGEVRTSMRGSVNGLYSYLDLGFRCVKDYEN